ncbi:MAG: GNAT family N-acetyltransferase [Candidatus Micrarchaeota archaeon]
MNVFIIEQKFNPGWEPDEDDKYSEHFIALDNEKIIATVRVREISKNEYKIERMAVMKEYRTKGVGNGLINHLLNYISNKNPKKIWLRSQLRSKNFYLKCGFKETSEPFDMYGVMHIDMEHV